MEYCSKLSALFLTLTLVISISSADPAVIECGGCPTPKPPKVKPPKVKPPKVKPPGILPPITGKPPGILPPIGLPPVPIIGKPPGILPPVLPIPPIGLPPILPIPPIGLPPILPIPPISVNPPILPVTPVLPPTGGTPPTTKPGCPTPVSPAPAPGPASASCPIDTLKLGACVDLLGGVVHQIIGTPISNTCCPIIGGLASFDAAACLCTTIKLKVLNIQLVLPIALQLLVTCGKTVPPGYTCA